MNDDQPPPRDITRTALIVELGLAVLALAIGWLVGHSPLASINPSQESLPANGIAAAWGLAATLPMLLVLALVDRWPKGWMAELQQVVDELILPLFARTTVAQMALISLAAGFGEEMLFRGLIQAGLAQWIGGPYGVWIAVILASMVFGVCHWITPTYALLAMGIGLYLGWLLVVSDNLLVPIVAHAVYDFLALVYLVKWRRSA
jgi:membrane protease YdiL (CAAX protease family)